MHILAVHQPSISCKKLQNQAARIVTNSPSDTSALPLIKSLGRLTIRELIDFETSKTLYKSLNALAPGYLQNIFQKVSEATNRQLRNSNKTYLRLPLLRISAGQKSFAYRGAKDWNDLDSVVKASSSLCTFRRKYKAKLLLISYFFTFLSKIIVNRAILYILIIMRVMSMAPGKSVHIALSELPWI